MTQSGARNSYYPGTQRVARLLFLPSERGKDTWTRQSSASVRAASSLRNQVTAESWVCVEHSKDVRGRILLWGPAVLTCTAGKHRYLPGKPSGDAVSSVQHIYGPCLSPTLF